MAVLSSRAQERRAAKPQSPRGFSALARLYYLARPTKTAMLRRLSKLLRCRSLVKPLISFSPLIAVFESYRVGILLVRQPPEIWTGQNNLFHLKHGQGYRSFLIGGDMKEK